MLDLLFYLIFKLKGQIALLRVLIQRFNIGLDDMLLMCVQTGMSFSC